MNISPSTIYISEIFLNFNLNKMSKIYILKTINIHKARAPRRDRLTGNIFSHLSSFPVKRAVGDKPRSSESYQPPQSRDSASGKKLQNLTRHVPATFKAHIRTCMWRKTALCSALTFEWPAGAAVHSRSRLPGCFQRWKSVRTSPDFSLVVSLPCNLAPLKSSTSRLGLNIWKMFRICRALLPLGATRLVSGNTGHPSSARYLWSSDS